MAGKLAIGRFVVFWQFSICYTDCRFTSDVESSNKLRIVGFGGTSG